MAALLGGSTGSARLELRVSVGEARRGAVFFEDLLYSARDRRRSPRHVHRRAQRAPRREPQHGRELAGGNRADTNGRPEVSK